MFDTEIHKVTWQQVGSVTEPGRYLFTFGWLTIKAEDIAIWQQHPNAAFTRIIQPSSGEADSSEADEFRLGTFQIPR